MGVYVLYLLGALSRVLWPVGFLVAFFFRGRHGDDDLGQRHLAHQVRAGIKLLIAEVVASVASLVLVLTVIGAVFAWVPLLAWCVWTLVVTLKGHLALAGERDPS